MFRITLLTLFFLHSCPQATLPLPVASDYLSSTNNKFKTHYVDHKCSDAVEVLSTASYQTSTDEVVSDAWKGWYADNDSCWTAQRKAASDASGANTLCAWWFSSTISLETMILIWNKFGQSVGSTREVFANRKWQLYWGAKPAALASESVPWTTTITGAWDPTDAELAHYVSSMTLGCKFYQCQSGIQTTLRGDGDLLIIQWAINTNSNNQAVGFCGIYGYELEWLQPVQQRSFPIDDQNDNGSGWIQYTLPTYLLSRSFVFYIGGLQKNLSGRIKVADPLGASDPTNTDAMSDWSSDNTATCVGMTPTSGYNFQAGNEPAPRQAQSVGTQIITAAWNLGTATTHSLDDVLVISVNNQANNEYAYWVSILTSASNYDCDSDRLMSYDETAEQADSSFSTTLCGSGDVHCLGDASRNYQYKGTTDYAVDWSTVSPLIQRNQRCVVVHGRTNTPQNICGVVMLGTNVAVCGSTTAVCSSVVLTAATQVHVTTGYGMIVPQNAVTDSYQLDPFTDDNWASYCNSVMTSGCQNSYREYRLTCTKCSECTSAAANSGLTACAYGCAGSTPTTTSFGASGYAFKTSTTPDTAPYQMVEFAALSSTYIGRYTCYMEGRNTLVTSPEVWTTATNYFYVSVDPCVSFCSSTTLIQPTLETLTDLTWTYGSGVTQSSTWTAVVDDYSTNYCYTTANACAGVTYHLDCGAVATTSAARCISTGTVCVFSEVDLTVVVDYTSTNPSLSISAPAATAFTKAGYYTCKVRATSTKNTASSVYLSNEFQVHIDQCTYSVALCALNSLPSDPAVTYNGADGRPAWVAPTDIIAYIDDEVYSTFTYTWMDVLSDACTAHVCGAPSFAYLLDASSTDPNAVPTFGSSVAIETVSTWTGHTLARKHTFNVQTSLISQVGIHLMKFVGTMTNPALDATYRTFTVDIRTICTECDRTKVYDLGGTDDARGAAATQPQAVTVLSDNVAVTQDFSRFQDLVSRECNHHVCPITYSVALVSDDSALTWATVADHASDTTLQTLTLQTLNLDSVSSYVVRIKAQVQDSSGALMTGTKKIAYSNQFTITKDLCNSCHATTFVPATVPAIAIGVDGVSGTALFTDFQDTVTAACMVLDSSTYTYNHCGNAVYTTNYVSGIIASPTSAQLTDNISANAAAVANTSAATWNRVVSTTDYLMVGITDQAEAIVGTTATYVYTITATIPAASILNGSTTAGAITGTSATATGLVGTGGSHNLVINPCSPLPCAYTAVQLATVAPVDVVVYTNGTVYETTTVSYQDMVSRRCMAVSGTYVNLCGAITYTLAQTDGATTYLSQLNQAGPTEASSVVTMGFSTTDTTLSTVGIIPMTLTATMANYGSISNSVAFNVRLSSAFPCDPLKCELNNELYDLAAPTDTVLPGDLTIDILGTQQETVFENFRDYYSTTCAGLTGANSASVQTLWTDPSCGQATYEVLYANTNLPMSSTFNNGGQNVVIVQSDATANTWAIQAKTVIKSLAGDHLLYVKATLDSNGVTLTAVSPQFTITVVDPCNPYDCLLALWTPKVTATAISDMDVNIKNGDTSQTIDGWSNSIHDACIADYGSLPAAQLPICGDPTFTLVLEDGSVLPFTTTKLTMTVNSAGTIDIVIAADDTTLAGLSYSVKLRGVGVSGGQEIGEGFSAVFVVNFIGDANVGPSITPPADIECKQGACAKVIALATALDTDGSIDSMTVDLSGASSFVTSSVSGSVATLTVLPLATTPVGDYTITFTATDDSGASAESTFTIKILAPEEVEIEEVVDDGPVTEVFDLSLWAVKEKNETEKVPLEVYIKAVNQAGLMEIRYTVPVVAMIQNVTQIYEKHMKVVYQQNPSSLEEPQGPWTTLNYTVTNFTAHYILVQMNFSHPLQISQGVKDEIQVYLNRKFFMVEDVYGIWEQKWKNPFASKFIIPPVTQGRRLQEINYGNETEFVKISFALPKQVGSAEELRQLEKNKKQSSFALSSLVWFPFAVQFLMSAAMGHVWNLLNTIRLLMTYQEFKTLDETFPIQVVGFLAEFKKIADLKIVDSEKLYKQVKEFFIVRPEGWTPEKQVEDISQQKKILEVSLKLFIGLLGVAVIVCIGSTFYWFCWSYMPLIVQRVFKRLKQMIMFNSVLRVMLETYLAQSLQLFTDAQKPWSFSSPTEIASVLLLLISIPYIAGFPVWINWFLHKQRFSLAVPDFKLSYNSIYLNVDYFKFKGLTFVPLTLVKQAIFAFTATVLGYSPILQLSVTLWTTQLFCQYLAVVQPMHDRLNNFVQLFNEWSILTITILTYTFVIIPSVEVRYELGWVWIYALIFNMAVNGFVIVTVIFQKIYGLMYQRAKQVAFKKRQQKILDHNQTVKNMARRFDREREFTRMFLKNNPLDQISEDSDESVMSLGEDKKEKHVSNAKRIKTAKQEFLDRMDRLREEDAVRDKEGQLQLDTYEPYAKKAEKWRQENFGPEPALWEDQMWNDVLEDPSGNVKKQRKDNGDWEVMSSPSVRERRRMQEENDWPLSARHQVSNVKVRVDDWDWDIEKAGSDRSNWAALPKEFAGQFDQSIDSSINSSKKKARQQQVRDSLHSSKWSISSHSQLKREQNLVDVWPQEPSSEQKSDSKSNAATDLSPQSSDSENPYADSTVKKELRFNQSEAESQSNVSSMENAVSIQGQRQQRRPYGEGQVSTKHSKRIANSVRNTLNSYHESS